MVIHHLELQQGQETKMKMEEVKETGIENTPTQNL